MLLLDNDPQASLTQGFFGPEATRAISPAETIAALYKPGAEPPPEQLIRPTGFDGMSLIPSSIALTRFNKFHDEEGADSQDGIRSLAAVVVGDFELALIDCPPNLHLCSWAALVGSDRIVVPLQAEDFGSQGLMPVVEAIGAVQAGPNSGLGLAGFLLTMFDKRLSVHVTYEMMLRELSGGTSSPRWYLVPRTSSRRWRRPRRLVSTSRRVRPRRRWPLSPTNCWSGSGWSPRAARERGAA